jgi:inosine-uridine nucleoside N-ribohydrolase
MARGGQRRATALVVAVATVLGIALGGCGGSGTGTSGTGSPPASARASPGSAPSRTMVIDTDMAVDDWLAILYLLSRPEVEVLAITIAGTGESHCQPGIRNARALAALAGQPDIPVACGRETPLDGDHAFPGQWRDRVDGLLGLSLPDGPNQSPPGTAVELLGSTLSASPDRVTLLTLGPLTNVAEALRDSPDLANRIDATYVMGGAVGVAGNVAGSGVGIDNEFAEWNVYCDPLAAKLVLEADVRVALVPLDATNQAPVSVAFADRLAADSATPQAKFVSDVLTQMHDSVASGTYYFWDPLAAAVLVDESLTSFKSASLSVVTDEGPESGRVTVTAAGPQTRYATSADLHRFEQGVIDTLNGR